MKPVIMHEEAEAELDDAVGYLQRRRKVMESASVRR
jgi:hypothetical protein